MLGRVPVEPGPRKNPEHLASLVSSTSLGFCNTYSWRNEACLALCDSVGVQTSPHAPFLFAGFVLYPFAGINDSHEYDCVASPVILPVNLPTWRWSWGPVTEKSSC